MLLVAVTVVFVTVDLLRLRVHRVKDVFIILFGEMMRRREFHTVTGGTYLLLASTVSIFIFEPRVLIPAISFLAIGDTAAAIVGLSVGRIRFWRKTLEGSLAGLVTCVGVAYVCSVLPYWSIPFPAALLGAFTASLVEALPIEVNDNVLVPIISGLVMQVALWLHVLGG